MHYYFSLDRLNIYRMRGADNVSEQTVNLLQSFQNFWCFLNVNFGRKIILKS